MQHSIPLSPNIWQSACAAHAAWCCRNEHVYASAEELARLGVEALRPGPNGDCPLLVGNACSRYADRPIECRIFPYDLVERGGVVLWVVWEHCPVVGQIDDKAMVDLLERSVLRSAGRSYIEAYLRFHAERIEEDDPRYGVAQQPRVVRPLRWPD